MPPVKIDYVVSFSSEDPEHPASNLLLSDVKSKWLCRAGEPSCSLVLQLKSACKIDSITIGAYHVALLEVLVGLSERPNDPFQVLVPSCVLLSPVASRRGDGVECVRTFGAAQLAAASAARWDRVRLVCSQPYNKHCKYGLAFVHMSSPDGQPAPAAASAAAPAPAPAPASAMARALRLDAEAGSSDDEFRPGELFARHRRDQLSQTTDAQIRQASSQALKNIPDASTRLTKTRISNTGSKDRQHDNEQRCDRRRESLLYTDDDDRPHAKIDRVMQRHNDNNKQHKTDATADKTDNKDKNDQTDRSNKLNIRRSDTSNTSKVTDDNGDMDKTKNNKPNDQTDHSSNRLNISRSETANTSKLTDGDGDTEKNNTPQKKDTTKNASNTENTASQKKRKRSAETHPELGPVCSSLSEVLSGAVLAMSGYVNPQRAALRAAALEMGAQYRRDWEPSCTHLICAFPNTPKLRAVREARAPTVAVSGDWVTQCRAHRRRLPWRWFATQPRDREPPPPGWERAGPASGGDDEDTDDEIEKALVRMRKKQRRASSADSDRRDAARSSSRDRADDPDSLRSRATDADATLALDASRESDVAFVRDERVQAEITLRSDSDATDEDERAEHADSVHIEKPLPCFWEGCTFVLSHKLRDRDAALLTRYIRAYGGLVLQESDVMEDCSVQYVVVAADEEEGEGHTLCAVARRVRPAWVWRQHRRKGGPASV